MASVGVLARFEFTTDAASTAAEFFENGRLVVEGQPESTRWYAFQLTPTTFGAFAVFATEADRDALLAAGGPRASRAQADLFAQPPSFEKVDIVAARPAD
jgi:hypothetical protein